MNIDNLIMEMIKRGKLTKTAAKKIYKTRDEIDKLIKTSELTQFLKPFLAGIGVGGLIGESIPRVWSAIRGSEPKFQEIMDKNPDLKLEDKKKVRKAFELLLEVSPKIVERPLLAGSIIKRMLAYETIDVPTLLNLLKATQDLQTMKIKPFTEVVRNIAPVM